MSECIYRFKDHEFGSKKEYENFLLQKGDELYEIYGDLVFSSLDSVITQEALKKVRTEAQKYVKAYAEAISNGLCTHEYATRMLYGLDFEEVAERLKDEKEKFSQGINNGETQNGTNNGE